MFSCIEADCLFIVSIESSKFAAGAISAAAHAPITLVNKDGAPHQVVVEGKPLRTAVLQKGQSGSITIADKGSYSTVCGLHPRHDRQEHDPFRLNRIMFQILLFGRVFYGEPVPTSPENALDRDQMSWCPESEVRFAGRTRDNNEANF